MLFFFITAQILNFTPNLVCNIYLSVSSRFFSVLAARKFRLPQERTLTEPYPLPAGQGSGEILWLVPSGGDEPLMQAFDIERSAPQQRWPVVTRLGVGGQAR